MINEIRGKGIYEKGWPTRLYTCFLETFNHNLSLSLHFIVHLFVKCMMNSGLHMILGVRYYLYIFIFMFNTYQFNVVNDIALLLATILSLTELL